MLCFGDQFTEQPQVFECAEILIPCWNVEGLPVFESSSSQIGVAEAAASFYNADRWLLGGSELNFDMGLERDAMPA